MEKKKDIYLDILEKMKENFKINDLLLYLRKEYNIPLHIAEQYLREVLNAYSNVIQKKQ